MRWLERTRERLARRKFMLEAVSADRSVSIRIQGTDSSAVIAAMKIALKAISDEDFEARVDE